jgi:hypothetical protein
MTDDNSVLDETQQVLEAEYLRMVRIEPLLRRASRALTDLGAPVPKEWATTDDGETFNLASLSAPAFDRLVCLLEDLAANRPITVTITRGGPTLFDPGPPTGPTAPHVQSSVHIVVTP